MIHLARAQDAHTRARELSGWTWQIPVDAGKVYVTVNHDGRRVVELLVANGPLSPAVGLLGSALLEAGMPATTLARTLDKVSGTHAIALGTRVCTSPEQAVAEYLRLASRRLRER